MKTRSIYHLNGIVKARTSRAVLFECSADKTGSVSQRHLQSSTKRVKTWIPLSVCTVNYSGPNYGAVDLAQKGIYSDTFNGKSGAWSAEIRIPGWMYSKLSWKDA